MVDKALGFENEWGCDGGDDVEGVFLALGDVLRYRYSYTIGTVLMTGTYLVS